MMRASTLDIEPGDTVVLQLQQQHPTSVIERVEARFKERLEELGHKGVGVLVLDGGASIALMKNGNSRQEAA